MSCRISICVLVAELETINPSSGSLGERLELMKFYSSFYSTINTHRQINQLIKAIQCIESVDWFAWNTIDQFLQRNMHLRNV